MYVMNIGRCHTTHFHLIQVAVTQLLNPQNLAAAVAKAAAWSHEPVLTGNDPTPQLQFKYCCTL